MFKTMKKLILLLFALSLLTTLSCNNDDDNNTENPILQLPPETQTGANTFGCLLDGEPFIPSGGINPLDAVYQFINGGYYFSVQGNRRNSENNLLTISMGVLNIELTQGYTYQLIENEDGNATGNFLYSTLSNYTSANNSGELTITKLDTENQIVSGTFWFDVVHPLTGEIAEIREGRFDMQYTQ
jgi:hypothetical protein